MEDLLFYITGLLLSFVAVFFKPPFLKSQMELSKAPRSCDFGGGDVFRAGPWEGVEGGGAGALGGGGIKDEPEVGVRGETGAGEDGGRAVAED